MEYAFAALAGAIVSGAICWLLATSRTRVRLDSTRGTLERANADLAARLDESQRRAEKVEATAKADFETLRNKLSAESQLRVAAERDRDNALARVAEERRLLDDAREKLKESFQALAGQSLKSSSEQFLELAKTKFDEVLSEAKGDLSKRHEAFKGIVSPISERLAEFEKHVRELETKREGAYSGIVQHMQGVADLQEKLRKETGNLVSALRSPQVRGRWGEVQLRRTVELAGMSDHCEFQEQVTQQSESGTVRPDLVITLPDNQKILVDSKVPLDAYLSAHSATNPDEQENFLKLHASRVRDHLRTLAKRKYAEHFDASADFVVMFIPVESSLSDALRVDASIYDESLEKGILLVTPSTLMGLLKTASLVWRQDSIARNAKEISELGRELHKRIKTLAEHFGSVGTGLNKATKSYNEAVRSLESRVLPQARKFQELGAATGDEIATLEPVELVPKKLDAIELLPDQSEDDTRTTPFRARGNEG